jgi:hypothetical protein
VCAPPWPGAAFVRPLQDQIVLELGDQRQHGQHPATIRTLVSAQGLQSDVKLRLPSRSGHDPQEI